MSDTQSATVDPAERFLHRQTPVQRTVMSNCVSEPGPPMSDLFSRDTIRRALDRLRTLFGFGDSRLPPDSARDPYAWRPVPRKPRPSQRSSAVAVAEPDE